jgi:hypothetical protein
MGSRVSRSGVWFLLVLAFTPGCSFLFVQPPPKNYDGRGRLACTTSKAPPVLDTLFTLTNVVSTLYVAGQDNVPDQGARVTLGLTVAGIWLASAIYGYTGTSECEAALAYDSGGRYTHPPSRPRPAPRFAPARPPAAPAAVAPEPEVVSPSVGQDGAIIPDPPPAPAPPRPPVQQQQDEDEPKPRWRPVPSAPPPPAEE